MEGKWETALDTKPPIPITDQGETEDDHGDGKDQTIRIRIMVVLAVCCVVWCRLVRRVISSVR